MNEKKLFIVEYNLTFPDGEQTRTELLKIPVVTTDSDSAFNRAQAIALPANGVGKFHAEYNKTYELVR